MKFYKDQRRTDFQVGLFTLVGIIILAASYFWLMEYLENRNYTSLKIAFDNAGNTEVGSPVSINGFKKGRVEKIEVRQEGIILHLKVELDFPLKADTKFLILESSLMGDVQVDIRPGREDALLALDELHQGTRRIGLMQLVSDLGEIVSGMQTILDKVYGQNNLFNNFQSVLDSTHVIIHKFNLSYDLNSVKIEQLIENSLQMTDKLNKFIDENENDLSNSVSQTSLLISEIDNTIQEINSITANLQQISRRMQQEDSSFSKLISEEELYDNLIRSTKNLDSLLIDIKKNPQRYFKLKVF